ncbi:hypothetical protein G6O67_003543 [Ophiocordyceps sinensis]|uniref:Uncharacterized protein n=2 Tax=Ophiocordyceps sinensis TaxID=72228 RepID=A0A8H4PRW8_9HYPO|nr:hypothetical protein OCS_02845 [Ophiocordyceps sinensis CO18]KAF4509365.1 hypothetical protein G6O67_003543 [Ophiocordyceps sinensis]
MAGRDGLFLASRTAAAEFAASCWTRLVGTGFAPTQSPTPGSPADNDTWVTVLRKIGPHIARPTTIAPVRARPQPERDVKLPE